MNSWETYITGVHAIIRNVHAGAVMWAWTTCCCNVMAVQFGLRRDIAETCVAGQLSRGVSACDAFFKRLD